MCWGTNLLGQCPASIHSSQNLQALHALGRGRRMVCLLPRLPWVLRQVFSRATDCTPLLCSARSWCPEHPSEMTSVGLGVPRAICRVPALPCSLALLLPWMVSVWPQMPAGVSCQSFTWSQAPKGKCPFFFFYFFHFKFLAWKPPYTPLLPSSDRRQQDFLSRGPPSRVPRDTPLSLGEGLLLFF